MFFQILFVTVRKATTSFTHKGTVYKNLLETPMGFAMQSKSFRGKHKSKTNLQTASLPRITDITIAGWKLTEFAAIQSSWRHPRKIIERLCLQDINFVSNLLTCKVCFARKLCFSSIKLIFWLRKRKAFGQNRLRRSVGFLVRLLSMPIRASIKKLFLVFDQSACAFYRDYVMKPYRIMWVPKYGTLKQIRVFNVSALPIAPPCSICSPMNTIIIIIGLLVAQYIIPCFALPHIRYVQW